jgi:ribose transport system substrate-binding protein
MVDNTTDGELNRRSYLRTVGGAAVAGTGLLAGCSSLGGSGDGGGDGDLTIGMETHFTSGAWVTALVEGAQFYALELGHDFNLFTNGQDSGTQISNINQMINQGYDGIIVVPWNSEAVASVLEDARDEGIAVYTLDIDSPTEAVSMNVSWDDTVAATACGEELASNMRDQHPDADTYRVLEVRAPPGTNISAARHDPFVDYVEGQDDIEIVGTLNGEWSRSTSNQRVREWMNANDAPHGIYAANFAMGLGAQSALATLGHQAPASDDEHITHVQLDGSSESHQAVMDGYIDYIVDQPVYFYGAIGIHYMVEEINNGRDSLPDVGTEITSDDLDIESGSYKGVDLWSEPIWAPGNVVETDSGHKRFVTNYVEITEENADEPHLWGNIWT